MRYLLMITMSLLRSRRTEEDHRASCAEQDELIALLPESRELMAEPIDPQPPAEM